MRLLSGRLHLLLQQLKNSGKYKRRLHRAMKSTVPPDRCIYLLNLIAVFSENGKGWTKELNKISWNGRPEKYDIRDWNHDEEKMGKGVTLSQEEFEALADCLK